MSDNREVLSQLRDDPEPLLDSPEPAMRRLAIVAAADHQRLVGRVAVMLATDSDSAVRRECAETLGRISSADRTPLRSALQDPDPEVREAAANALGELGDRTAVPELVALVGNTNEDALVREAAVAALGAIGDTRALPILLENVATAPPQVRRRCVVALTVFDGDEVEIALRRAAADRNPMVREAAEMVVGRSVD